MDSILFERINDLCHENNITIKKLSAEVGISESLIRKWKSSNSPSVDKVKAIATYFGVSMDYLIGLSDIRDPAEKVLGDNDIVSLQRARNKMGNAEKERMMKMVHLAFHYAFEDEDGEKKD